MSCAHVGSRFPEVLSFTFEMSMFTSGVSPKLSLLPGEASGQPRLCLLHAVLWPLTKESVVWCLQTH